MSLDGPTALACFETLFFFPLDAHPLIKARPRRRGSMLGSVPDVSGLVHRKSRGSLKAPVSWRKPFVAPSGSPVGSMSVSIVIVATRGVKTCSCRRWAVNPSEIRGGTWSTKQVFWVCYVASVTFIFVSGSVGEVTNSTQLMHSAKHVPPLPLSSLPAL